MARVAAALAVAAVLFASAPSFAQPPARSAVLGEIAKEHNLDLGGGRLVLRLTVPADLQGSKGDTVGMDVWFADEQGTLLRSALPAFADASGFLHAVSKPATVEKDPEGFSFVFTIPYGAFPCGATTKYRVEARAVLSLRSAASGESPSALGSKTTTFFVEG